LKRNFARGKGERQYRPEQFKLQELFKVYAPNLHIELEYPIMMGGQCIAVPDLIDLDNKIVYRLNGEAHSGRQLLKDENQRMWLEIMGYKVEDINKDSWTWNWLWE